MYGIYYGYGIYINILILYGTNPHPVYFNFNNMRRRQTNGIDLGEDVAGGGGSGDGGESESAGLLSVMSTSGGRMGEEDWDDAAGVNVGSLLEREDGQDDMAVFSGHLLKRGYRFGNLLAGCPACCGCKPVWKKRYFIMRGGFLFKFAGDSRKARPKGTPIPLANAQIDFAGATPDDDHDDFASFDGNIDSSERKLIIHISTIRKEYTLKADTTQRRDEWIRRLRHAKQIAIKVSLGHAKQTNSDRAATRAGNVLFKRGIRREINRAKQTIEMQQMVGAGIGPPSTGY